jgi:NAD(P)H-hydrate epimerase
MMGAPALCATSAFRSGAGLVKAAVPANVLPVVIGIEPGATGIPLTGDVQEDASLIHRADPKNNASLAIGCGMGPTPDSGRLVMALVKQTDRAVVLDADGLNLLCGHAGRHWVFPRPAIVTPHAGEFSRLAHAFGVSEDLGGPQQRILAASALALRLNAIVVLKGRGTVISDGLRFYVNRTGNPALATAGTGDVLTGLIAGFVAQKMALFDAAVLGVYLHGLASDLWASGFGARGLTAVDLAKNIPAAFRFHHTKLRSF